MNAPHGPYDSQAQVTADLDALHLAAHEAGQTDMAPVQVRALLGTVERLGVEAGSYDELILASIGLWEPLTTVVLVGLIERAHAAGAQSTSQETK